jgi:hypothetical protein
MIMRRPYSCTATRRDHLTEATRNAQVTTVEVKEQAKRPLENWLEAAGLDVPGSSWAEYGVSLM